MDPKFNTGTMVLAPFTHGGVESCPPPRGRTERPSTSVTSFPPVDRHIVQPELTYDEVIRGRKVTAMTALPPHADAQGALASLIGPHLRPGWIMSTELLTRVLDGSDFATDVCVRKAGIDPETGSRYLEELSFEVVNEQKLRDVTEKAEDLIHRGVRRVFAIFVKRSEVAEWSKADEEFVPLDNAGVIEDPLFVRPIAVKALSDSALVDDEIARALIVKGNSAITELTKDAHDKGRKLGVDEGRKLGVDEGRKLGVDEGLLKGRREALIDQLDERFGDVPADVLARIHTADIVQLRAWSKKLLATASLEDVFVSD